MKIPQIREFRPLRATGEVLLSRISEYLRTELLRTLKDLMVGLNNLSLEDNFDSFEVEVSITTGAELQIRNEFDNGLIPSKRLIVRGGTDAQNIVDGDTEWDRNFVYLKNTGATTAMATVVFLR